MILLQPIPTDVTGRTTIAADDPESIGIHPALSPLLSPIVDLAIDHSPQWLGRLTSSTDQLHIRPTIWKWNNQQFYASLHYAAPPILIICS